MYEEFAIPNATGLKLPWESYVSVLLYGIYTNNKYITKQEKPDFDSYD